MPVIALGPKVQHLPVIQDGPKKTFFFFFWIIILYCDRIYYMYCALREVVIGGGGVYNSKRQSLATLRSLGHVLVVHAPNQHCMLDGSRPRLLAVWCCQT
jgi:hypothetical protein